MRIRAIPARDLPAIAVALLIGGCDRLPPTDAIQQESAAMGLVTASPLQPGKDVPFHVSGIGTLVRQ